MKPVFGQPLPPDTNPLPSFAGHYPNVAEAIRTARSTVPASWENSDELDVLAHLAELCTWIGPFLPKPEMLALATVANAGKKITYMCDEGPTPEAMRSDLMFILAYLAAYGAALEYLSTHAEGGESA